MVFPDNGADVHRTGGFTQPRYMHHMREGARLKSAGYGAETLAETNGLRLEPLESESHVPHCLAYLGPARLKAHVNFPLLLSRRFQLSVWPRNYEKGEGWPYRTPAFYPSMKSG